MISRKYVRLLGIGAIAIAIATGRLSAQHEHEEESVIGTGMVDMNSASVSCSNVAVCRSHNHFAAVKAATSDFGAIKYPIRSAEKIVRENVPT